MKEYISVQGSRARLEGTNNLGDEDYDTLPLTRDDHEVFYIDPQTNPDSMLAEPLKQKKVSMLSVCTEMFKRGAYWELLASTMNWNSVGRGGEAGLTSYQKMQWNNIFNVIVASWYQQKTLISTPTTWIADFCHPELCVLFSMACCWMCKDGINRPLHNSRDKVEKRYSMRVFSSRPISTRNVTSSIRKGIDLSVVL